MDIGSETKRRAQRELANFRGFIRRQVLTGWTSRNARFPFERALKAVAAFEDEAGVDAAAKLSDRLTALRREALAAGLLSYADVLAAERRLLGPEAGA